MKFSMRYRPLGRTGLQVSEIGFGCASLWEREGFDETEAIALVHAAADHGVMLFDTDSSYSKTPNRG
jgi:aryl-alcohol dehydrogenase-like predicted oxidoreductase